ncbi:MAG TPA: hypothetical protein VKG25_19795 [Bryobacteraceae bacterium]|nr:hypothetical protein [Bryobacteraceae bacterium]
MNDLRIPIGLFFSITGAILLITAFTGHSKAPIGSENVNLYSGLCMLVFGSVMLWLARRAA